jgi:hypothetical protein
LHNTGDNNVLELTFKEGALLDSLSAKTAPVSSLQTKTYQVVSNGMSL